MKKHLLLWLATATLSLGLSVFVPYVEPELPVACRSTPVGQVFAWADGGHLICMPHAAAAKVSP